MSLSTKYSRRKFMQIAAAATAAGPMVACRGSLSPWRCLTEDDAQTLEAICERLIPTDQDPGAAWAGVVIYIDRQLAGPYRKQRKAYRLGLAATNTTSLAKFGRPFATIDSSQQDTILQSMEGGEARGDHWKQVSAKSFFELVLQHTQQGFYGDPRHGGNRERVSWKMLGLAYPQLRGRMNSQQSTNRADLADKKSEQSG